MKINALLLILVGSIVFSNVSNADLDAAYLIDSTDSTDCQTYDNSQKDAYLQKYSTADLRKFRDQCFNLYRKLTTTSKGVGYGKDTPKSIWANDTGAYWDQCASIQDGHDKLKAHQQTVDDANQKYQQALDATAAAAKAQRDAYCNNPAYIGVKDTPYCLGTNVVEGKVSAKVPGANTGLTQSVDSSDGNDATAK